MMSMQYGYGLDSDVDSDVNSDSGDSECGVDFSDSDDENRAKKPRLGADSADNSDTDVTESELSMTVLFMIWVLFFSPLPLNIFGMSPAFIILALSHGGVGTGN